ncbi:hypothetical protein Pmar_PMAR015627 [Perkinsus marinus ATCC 50983]|uniref:Integrase catalytic domain-containing protein n=1 Tax=Perkinsus marinus (strain ATCC 50983 / TXsc) TaxID=423536 RepID=C5K471_PERM5|nr:hypothetical protein Pmar_PMAR015627 [Perkinsus marinus ATCC 50983]EER20687.1 hypothetical protein Pmar_PMAR015627 [Perkinsus marinus ATCC 50983]|eukprot:XP_002788891.1 hypothetical protein Pmar_PMAR015627 [Perkinsus marinus ATCC 50983]
MSYKWSPPCTQYFLTRQVYAPFIVQRLDLWETKQDYGPLLSCAQDPYSTYWKEATRRQWFYLSACFDKHNSDSLECRWSDLKLTPNLHWDDYITQFEVVASQLAQARGVNALTQAELRAHLYLSLPKALQAHCVQLGYNVGEKRMDYDGLVNTCAGWCELNWQTLAPAAGTATVNNVALASVPSAESCTPQVITSSSTTTQENQQKTDKKTRPTRPSTPYRQRIKDDSSILNDEYNIKILSSRCQRCLSESHDTIACCEELTKKDERCYYCGLIHHHSRHCPAGHDNYRGRNCERCNKVNHAARACRRYRPGAAPVAAAIPSTGVPKSASTTGTPPLSFINLYVNHSSGHTPALVDSGAAVSVVSSSAAASLNLTVSRADLRIRLADLSETPVRGVAKSVPISFSNGSRCTEDLYVLDGCAHQLILSVGLLRRLKAIWHLHDNYIVFGDNEDGQPISMVSMPKPRNEPSSPSVYSSTVAELCNIMVSEARSTQRGTCCDVDTSESNTITLPQDVWETLALSFFPEPREDDSSPTKGLTRSQTIDAFRDQFTDQRSSEKHGNDLFDFSIDPPSDTAPRGRLHCKVPWRDAARPSPIHNQSAIKRDCIVMARLTDAEASSYHQVVNDLYTLGFVVPARLQSTPDTEPSTVMYTDHSLPPVSTLIPAFPVFRKCSKTSKTRLVLDCKYHNGFLRSGRQANDTTYPETLWANLALSRTAKAMVVDDISKAYHQIKLGDALDRRHFGMMACGRVGMWVSTCSGATYSPSALLQANKAVLTLRDFESGHITRDQALTDPVCRSLISQFEGNLKLGSLTLNHGDVSGKNSATSNNGQDPLLKHTAIYVDDGQTRGKTKEVALKRANFFTATQSGHGFHSNVPKRSRSWGPITSTKYLGYGWQTGDESDQLSPTFRVPEAFDLDNPPSTITRRQLFSLCQGLYDPLGLASEYSLCLRLFMATYYTVDVTNHAGKPPNLWDIDIDPEGAANVLSFCRALTTADLLYPRFADISNMMVFTDASVTAGHATILCPTTDSEGSVFYHKLVGKGRLWSTRTSQARWSIPKKELVAFFDGLTLATSLVTLYSKFAIETPIKCLSLYCDSEALLYRLRRASKGDFGKTLSNLEKKALKRGLVDLNHIATTLRVPVTTYHIEGEANPADTGSRPKINGQLPSPLEDAVIEKGINAAHAKNLSYVYTLEATPVTDVLSYDTISVANHFNNDQLLKFQQEDGRARAIVDTLNSTPSAEVAHNLRLYHICPDSGLLLYSGVSDSNGGTACRPVLPRGQGCDEVLSLLHDKLGHDNAPKLRSLYNEAFYTPKLRIALLRLLKTCHVCQLAKKQSGYKKRAGCVRPAHLCFDIGQVWCLDHAGPYRCPVSGEKIWVLTCCDPVSGFLLYDNTTSPTASSICSSLIKLFSIVGDPACITVDAGSAMTSRAVEGFCVTRSIAFTVFPRQSKFIAAVYERGHGLLLSQLRHRLLQEEDQPRPLPDTIAEAVYGINCSPRHDLGTLSAFQLFYCRRPRLLAPAEELEDWSRAKLENWIPSITEGQPPTMSSELKAIYDDLQERRTRSLLDFFTLVKEAKDRIRARASKLPQQSGFKAFDIGSLVLRLVPPPLKQDVSWRGPYRVVAVSDDQLLYRLEDVKTGTQLKFQECYFNLKQYHAKNPVLESLPVPTVQDGSTLNLTDGDLYCFRWIDGHGCEHRDFGLYDSDLKKMVLRKVHIDGSIEILTDFIDQQYVCDVDIHYECPLRMTRSIKNRIIKYIEGGNLCDAD